MAETYLITPDRFDPAAFAPLLERVLDAVPVACVRLALKGGESDIAVAAGALQSVCHGRDIALVIAEHFRLVKPLGLDGVHLNGTTDIRAARETMHKGAILGSFCGTSRHAGMTAAEMGADYVSFGPVSRTGLGSGAVAEEELFAWWAEMIETPVVAEGAVTTGATAVLDGLADFIAAGDEIWSAPDPVEALRTLLPPPG